MLSVILKGQISYKITGHSGNQVCIPVSLMDTIIHDLKQRKLLIKKDSLNSAYISVLKDDIVSNNTKIYETEKSLFISESKRKRNGWQRNMFIVLTVVSTFFLIR